MRLYRQIIFILVLWVSLTNLKHLLKHFENHVRQVFPPRPYDIVINLNMIWLHTRTYFLHRHHHFRERIVCLSKDKRTFYRQLHQHFLLIDVKTRQASIFYLTSTLIVVVVDLDSHQELDLYSRQMDDVRLLVIQVVNSIHGHKLVVIQPEVEDPLSMILLPMGPIIHFPLKISRITVDLIP